MSFVQSNVFWDDTGDSQTSVPLAFSSNVTVGNVMVVGCFFQENDITPTVADTLGSTWNLGQRYWNAGEVFGVIWYWAVAPSSGANTVTFSFSTATSQVRIAILEEADIASVSPIDDFNGNLIFFDDNNVDAVSSGSFTPVSANTRVVGMAFMTGAVTLSAGTSFTMHSGSSTLRTWIETRTLAVASPTAATFTMATSTSIGGVIGLALKPSAVAAYSITAEMGNYVMTGQTVNLLAGGFISAEPGSYTLLGSEALRDIEMDADSGSYDLAGQDAGLIGTLILTAESGTYSLIGQAANILYSFAASIVRPKGQRRLYGFRLNR